MAGGRNRVIVKVARLILILRGKHWMPDVADLAVALECSPRTVYRYLDGIEEGGYPLPPRPRDEA